MKGVGIQPLLFATQWPPTQQMTTPKFSTICIFWPLSIKTTLSGTGRKILKNPLEKHWKPRVWFLDSEVRVRLPHSLIFLPCADLFGTKSGDREILSVLGSFHPQDRLLRSNWPFKSHWKVSARAIMRLNTQYYPTPARGIDVGKRPPDCATRWSTFWIFTNSILMCFNFLFCAFMLLTESSV